MTSLFNALARLIVVLSILFSGLAYAADNVEPDDYQVLKEIILLEFSRETPHEWGAVVPGVKTKIKTDQNVIALTFDLKGQSGAGIDSEVLQVLEKEHIPATFFACGKWLDQNLELAKKISSNSRFTIANLGLEAKSCSVNGKSANGEPATKDAAEVFSEIERNARKIETLTGTLPQFFRAGTAYYDDVAVRIARALGYEVVGSNLPVQKSAGELKQAMFSILLQASAGTIASLPLENPGAGMASELARVISRLRAKGFQFVALSDYPLE